MNVLNEKRNDCLKRLFLYNEILPKIQPVYVKFYQAYYVLCRNIHIFHVLVFT